MGPSATDSYTPRTAGVFKGMERGATIVAVSVPQDVLLEVCFHDGKFTYHAQWLHDARGGRNPSRSAEEAFSVHEPDARILEASSIGNGASSAVRVSWADGTSTDFPGAWLRVFAPLVAQADPTDGTIGRLPKNHGWMADSLHIPEVDWTLIFPQGGHTPEQEESISIKMTDLLLYGGSSGIIKIVNLPEADYSSEKERKNTLVTKVLKQVFGQVFAHPRRGQDETFNITDDYGKDQLRGQSGLQSYRVDQVLLPHVDHAHYEHPAQVMGLYCLEGESFNTFVSSVAALETMGSEAPDLVPYLSRSPVITGRVAHFYDPPMYQAVVEPAVTMMAGSADHVKRIRWHCHLSGCLASPFDDFVKAREAYGKYQEILRRPSHQLTVKFKTGDLYVWNNHVTLHGRESVIGVPRTSVGNTVPEHVVSERYRSLQMKRLSKVVDESWLVHVPTPQLAEMAKLLGGGE